MSTMKKIGFLGAGRMASAIACGMVKNKFKAENIFAYDCLPEAGKALASLMNATLADSPVELVTKCDALVLAVKPQYLAEALQPISGMLKDKLIMSIVAGVKIEKLATLTGASRIVRVMPNTPALLGEGCGAYTLSAAATADDRELAKEVLASIGECVELPEKQLDAVTAVSGCGPAFVYMFAEALADGAVECGLARDKANLYAAQTLLGAARMLIESGKHPGELKDAVCSPGGTTIAGVHALEDGEFRACVMDAVGSAYERTLELKK